MTNDNVYANWDEVAEDGALPTMRANALLARWEWRETSSGRRMLNIGWQIEEPEKYQGMFQNDNIIVGGDKGSGKEKEFDPKQQDSRRLRGMLESMGIPLNSDVNICMRAAEGKKCSMFISAPSEKDIAAGYDRSRVRKYHQLGAIEPAVLSDVPNVSSASPAAPPPAPPPALPGQPTTTPGDVPPKAV